MKIGKRSLTAIQNNLSAPPLTNPFRYTAREFDSETSLYYYRARYYDPNTGRFISEDPIGFLGSGTNLYAYTGNSPVMFTDPSGKVVPLIIVLPVIGGLVGGIADVLNAGPCQNKFAAFGRGFASGALGTLVGIGVGALTGNPLLAGAAGGEISSIADQGLAGERLDAVKVAEATGVGAVGGFALSRIFPTAGRLPSLTRPSGFGPNSARLLGQEAGNDALGGTAQYLLPHSKPECGCK